MKNFRISLITLTLLVTTACSSTPVKSKNELHDALLGSHVVVSSINNPAQLSERTKAQAIGNMVVSSVISSVAASGGGPVTAQQMQSNMQIVQSFNQNLQQALPKSYAVSAGKGADLALAKKISDFFNAKALPESQKQLAIAVNTPVWELAYISMLTSQDYALNYGIEISILENKDGKMQALSSTSCKGSAKHKMPLDQWKAENYKAVDADAEFIVNECFNQFLAQTGLN